MQLTRKAIPFAAALALAGLLPAASAHAQGRYGDYDRYDRRGGYAYGRSERTEALARQLAREADRLHRQAESVNRHPNPPVARMLESLHRLDDSAARFAQVAGYSRNDRYGRYDRDSRYGRRSAELDDLLDAYAEVYDAVDDINPQRYLTEGLARCDSLMDQITGGYDRYGSYGRRGGYGRYRGN